ncbi:SET and MYND domain-containing protein 4-like [Hetaerina americana]|uniref:SET and MYND domain-containing protein 4-like n=1 Tax=Hetaerina americana TaxID=62018 RepID=UPI003A7F23AD
MTSRNSFSNIYDRMCQSVQQKGCVEEISENFARLTSDSERYKFVSKLLYSYGFNWSSFDEKILSKCENESVRLRNEGNELFIKGKDAKALNLYSRSALFAPRNTELSMAYANRSAVLAALKYFRDSVADIERAMELNLPDHLKYKLIKRKGECLCQLGNHSEAQKCYSYSSSLLKSASKLPENKQKEIELKLSASLKECLEHSDVRKPVDVGIECLPTLSGNEEVPSASGSVKISYDESLGRHIVATRYIGPGEVIAIEDPFASILLPESFLSHCYHCLRRCWALIPCRKCCHVMFCSEECSSKSWSQYHEKECSILPYMLELDMGKMAHLALRIVLLLEFSSLKNLINSIDLNPYSKCHREKGFSENGKYISSHYTPIYHLEGHSSSRNISDVFKRACISFCIVSCLKNHTKLFSSEGNSDEIEMLVGELILRHMQNLPCNAHEVSELLVEKEKVEVDYSQDRPDPELTSSLNEIGAAAYAMLSLINHSCDPNVVRHNYGSSAVLRAIRPIQEGEQLLDNYGYHYAVHSLKLRKDNLREQYFFECMCTPCSELWPTYHLMQNNDIGISLRCPYCMIGPLGKANNPENQTVKQISELFFCNKCEKTVDITSLKEKLVSSSEEFKILLRSILAGHKVDKMKLLNHLILMDNTLVRPWKEYNDCQEAIKHVFALEGNCFYV